MFAILNCPGPRLVRLGFRAPPVRQLDPERHVRWVLERFSERRDALWDLDPRVCTLALLKVYYSSPRDGTDDPALARLLSAFACLGSMATPARYVAHDHLLEGSVELRVAAIHALGSIGHPESAAPLQPLLNDSEPAVRRAAAVALSKLGTPAELLRNVSHADAELSAIVDLGQRAHEARVRGDELERVRCMLSHADFYEDLCGHISDVFREVAHVLRDRTQPTVARARAARVLGLTRARFKAALDAALAVAFSDAESLELRIAVVGFIGRARLERAVPILCRLLDTPLPSLQDAVIDALGDIGDARAIGPLLNHYDDRNGACRERIERAIFALGQPLEEDDYEAFARGALELDVRTTYFFVDGMTLTLPRERLLELLQDPSPAARRDAALLFGLLGSRDDVPTLKSRRRTEPDPSTERVLRRAATRLSTRDDALGER